ncbi:MAG: MarR family transcriptional regulator [Treponema sp.]|nr:MarR family transcriptional regulator [Treponema sp.]
MSELNEYDCLKLSNQLCFPLYAASREILRMYTPLLKEIDLTYTQYIVMMVLWEEKEVNVGELGKKLFLDTGTLSPLLKSMEKKNLLTRKRDSKDERIVKIMITEEGQLLKEKAVTVPQKIGGCVNLSAEDAQTLYKILYKILPSA